MANKKKRSSKKKNHKKLKDSKTTNKVEEYHCSNSRSSSLVPVSSTFFVLVFPVIPLSCFFLISGIIFLLIRVSIDLILFFLFLLSFHSLHHVIVFHVAHFFQWNCGFVGIFLPHLGNYLLTLIKGTGRVLAVVLISFWKVWKHLRVDFLWFFDLVVSHFWYGFRHFLFVFFFCFFIFLDCLFVV